MTISEPTDPVAISVKEWVESFVIRHDLCPFAARELRSGRVRFVTSKTSDPHQLLLELYDELNLLQHEDTIETTMLIHPHVLQSFADYNQFLDLADALLHDLQLEGVFQIASFHPDYQFDGVDKTAAENYTNRSPYPLLHILRESSVEKAVRSHPDTEAIAQRNIKKMQELMANKKD